MMDSHRRTDAYIKRAQQLSSCGLDKEDLMACTSGPTPTAIYRVADVVISLWDGCGCGYLHGCCKGGQHAGSGYIFVQLDDESGDNVWLRSTLNSMYAVKKALINLSHWTEVAFLIEADSILSDEMVNYRGVQ